MLTYLHRMYFPTNNEPDKTCGKTESSATDGLTGWINVHKTLLWFVRVGGGRWF